MADCLNEADLRHYQTGEIDENQRARIESHLETCDRCASRHAARITSDVESPGDSPTLGRTRTECPHPSSKNAVHVGKDAAPSDETLGHRQASQFREVIGGYEILRELGRGGMGIVYEAIQAKLNRKVALKVLPVMAGPADRDAISRFRREATAAATLHHTHIVPIYDFGESGHAYYYAMELIEGRSLTEMIRYFAQANAPAASRTALAEMIRLSTSKPHVPAGDEIAEDDSADSPASGVTSDATGRGRTYYLQVAQWMADAADALHHAHSKGIIHRDIKPGNLFLSRDGRIMLLDFGLAKSAGDLSVTTTGSLVGTLRYMSPEQAMAKRMIVDHRTDVYSLGATMYELLTFQPAFKGHDEKETLGLIITRDPTPPRKIVPPVPRELETICLKSLEKNPDARYATARDLAEDLRRYTQDLPIVARPVGPLGRAMKYVRRHRAATVAACALLLLAVAVASAVISSRHAREERLQNLHRQAVAHWLNHEWTAAQEAFEATLVLAPDNAKILTNFASAKKDQYNEERDEALLAEAADLLERALRIEPDQVRVWNIKGVILRMQGRVAEAIEAHKKGIALDEDYYANWVSLANAHAVHGDTLEAEKCLIAAIDLVGDAGGFMPWHNLAAVRLHLQKPEALTAIARALELSKDNAQTRLVKLLESKLYLQLPGRLDPKKALEAAITAEGLGKNDANQARIDRILAQARLRNQDWDEAADEARQLLESGTQRSYAHLILSVAHAHLSHSAMAREHLQFATESWPVELEEAGVIVAADHGLLWFDTAADLDRLRTEAERLSIAQTPR